MSYHHQKRETIDPMNDFNEYNNLLKCMLRKLLEGQIDSKMLK